MGTLPEQFFTAGSPQYQAQLDLFRMLTGKAFDSAGKIISLNISTACRTIENSSMAMTRLMTARDPRDLLALASQAQSNAANMLAYGNELFGIATGLQSELLRQSAGAAASAPAVSPSPAPEMKRAQDTAPQAAAAPPAEEAAEPAKVVKPSKKPAVAVKPPPAPEPVAQATPIAKAVSEVVHAPAIAAKPAAAPVPSAPTPPAPLDAAALHASLKRAPKRAGTGPAKTRGKK